jgi:hypothetical protein
MRGLYIDSNGENGSLRPRRHSPFLDRRFVVGLALKKVGRNLRLPRLRRKQTIEEVAKRIGTGSRAIRGAESGKYRPERLTRVCSLTHATLAPAVRLGLT